MLNAEPRVFPTVQWRESDLERWSTGPLVALHVQAHDNVFQQAIPAEQVALC
jgi:hypothetical protein